MSEVTQLLDALEHGEKQAANELLPLVYDELRKLAAQKLAQEKPGQTLQATALVHEAFLRLVGPANADGFASRGHFFGAAAEAMRRILVEQARRKSTEKQGAGRRRVDLSRVEAFILADSFPNTMLELNESLEILASQDPSAAELFKLRYFAGLSVEEAAQELNISRTQAYRLWTFLAPGCATQGEKDNEMTC